MELRGLLDPDLGERVRRAATGRGLAEEEARAMGEAAMLRAALRARAAGRSSGHPDSTEVAMPGFDWTATSPTSGDTAEELSRTSAWLGKVARASRKCPPMRAIM